MLLMIMGKLYHYCANNQKTGDPEWELMSSALESMLATIEHDRAGEFTPLETPSVFSPVHRDGVIPSISQFLAKIHTSS